MSEDSPTTARATSDLRGRARRLEYLTIAWNVGEAFLTIGLGIAAASLALIGFGADSIVEVFASTVVVWHAAVDDNPARAERALRLVSVAFFVLGAFLTVGALSDLLSGRRAEESLWGIAYLAATAVIMFALAVAKLRVAAELSSSPLRSEAHLTFLDGMLASLTVVGLSLNAGLGWWWADPAAALLVALASVRQGFATLTEAREGDFSL